jgi:AraC-like DNA-binding protein
MEALSLRVGQWESLQRELVWIRKGKVEKRTQQLPYRPGNMIAAWRLIRGSARFDLSTGKFQAGAGQWIFPGYGTGMRTLSADAEIISVRFRVRWPDGSDLFDHQLPLAAVKKKAKELDAAGWALAEYVQNEVSPSGFSLPQAEADMEQYLQIRKHFEKWFAAYVHWMSAQGQNPARMKPVDERILDAIQVIDARVTTGEELSEEFIAREVGLSLSHFKRLFVRNMNTTFKGLVHQKRYIRACDRLCETVDPIKQIGFDLGFRSPNHFSSWFRKASGRNPTSYRRENTTL